MRDNIHHWLNVCQDRFSHKYKAKTDLVKMGQVASVLALLAGVLGGLHLLMSARVCLYWLCMRFGMAQVVMVVTMSLNVIGCGSVM